MPNASTLANMSPGLLKVVERTTSHIDGRAGWWKSPCPDLARGRGGQPPVLLYNGIFTLVSTGAHPRNPAAWTPQRLCAPLPAPARRLAGCGGQPAPWRMRRLALGLPFLACLIPTVCPSNNSARCPFRKSYASTF